MLNQCSLKYGLQNTFFEYMTKKLCRCHAGVIDEVRPRKSTSPISLLIFKKVSEKSDKGPQLLSLASNTPS